MATPLGNLDDMVPRAVKVLQSVALVAAEDTRRTGLLLDQLGINQQMLSVHDHNERDRIPLLLDKLGAGQSIALVSDAGTPAISDPGYRIVAEVVAAGFDISVIPGPCAAVVALAGGGLPTDRFTFIGFPPARSGQRRQLFSQYAHCRETLVIYESVHRIDESLADAVQIFGADRRAVVARELTKLHESWYRGSLTELLSMAREDANFHRGELVILIEGQRADEPADSLDLEKLCRVLADELPPGRAASAAARISGKRRKDCFELIMAFNPEHPEAD